MAVGTALYHKPVVTAQGMSQTAVPTPIRYADIELVSCQSGAVLAAGETDADGRFRLAFVNAGQVGVYVRVLSSSTRYGISVQRSAAQPFLYGLTSLAFDDAGDGETTIVTGLETMGALGTGAFNILAQGVRGAETVEELSGAPPTPPMIWYWFPGNANGTFYSPVTKTITVLGATDDPDEFDDAVLLHEYGHYVLDVYSRDDSPGGPHVLGDSTLDLRLAWSEGWATFFSSVARNDPLHVDSGGGGVRLVFDIEEPSFGAATRYDTNELAVAAVLWDAHDTANADEGAGPLGGLLPAIWSVVGGLSLSPVTFEDFWTAWQAASPGDLQPILAGRSIDLWPDEAEAAGDDDPSRATPIRLAEVQHHSLSPAGDVDYVEFIAPADGVYTIATARCVQFPVACDARLSNAADTILDVLGLADDGPHHDNPNGEVYQSSCTLACPPNDAATLSSGVTFAAAAGTSYIVQISRSPVAPPSAGELGSYDVVVTAGN